MPVDPIPVAMLLAVAVLLAEVYRRHRGRPDQPIRAVVTVSGVVFLSGPPPTDGVLRSTSDTPWSTPARTSPTGCGRPARPWPSVPGTAYASTHPDTGTNTDSEDTGRHHWRPTPTTLPPAVEGPDPGWVTVLSGHLPLPAPSRHPRGRVA
ncbi:hypothetical protein G443_003387 [Actinoalloteichus cyanogriseus DSM 43889]|uniref:Uncharacterized protein n=1 Tax=Actinoalloteichus caeruleus DSM 43889 TaxID=1120930 RepID=A0ABT1JKS5_ACTCY|nr:hypothetical protein [Actinoalloteichus caeruleus DSM 43889]